jgi:hypothetical protein
MSTKLETETSAFKTIEAWKDQAAKAGLVLRAPQGTDYGGYPARIYDLLTRFRRNIAITKDHKKIVKTMARQLVTTKDEKGRPTKKEYLTYQGYYSGLTYKGEEYQANFEIGKYQRPKIVHNSDIRYDPKTGDPIGSEKALGTPETIHEIEVPKTKEARKKLVDSILGDDNYADNVLYYVRHLNESNYENSRDNTFSYEEFVSLSIEDLVDTSQKGAGSKSSPYYTDKEGQLRYKKTDTPVTSKSNKGVYS